MIDKTRQIEYWISNAENDLESAILLIKNNKILHGLFFCHLVIEKAIKAHVVKYTHEIPPKTHNLIFLAEKANLELFPDSEIFIGILMKFQLEGRYPDFDPEIPPKEVSIQYLIQTKELLEWLKNLL